MITAAGIGQALLGFLLYLAAVALFLRLRLRAGPAAVALTAAVLFWFLTLAGLLAAGQRVNFWIFSTIYWFLTLWFLMAFGAIHKSISLWIVGYLSKAASRSAAYGKLQHHVLDRSFQERLAIIEESGYAHRVNDRFALTPSGVRIARCAHNLQRVFRIARSG